MSKVRLQCRNCPLLQTHRPQRLIQIHEVLLSEIGQQAMAGFLSPERLSPVPLTIVPPGNTIAL